MKIVLMGALALLSCGIAQAQTARAVMTDIREHGARAVVADYDRAGRFDTLLRTVATGDPGWIAVSASLFSGTDAGTTEGLLTALSQAMIRNPDAVLRAYGPSRWLRDICDDRLIEPPPSLDAAFRRAFPAALARVRDPALLPARDRCAAFFAR